MEHFRENLVDNVLDALETAKRAHSLLPPLPPALKPIHLRVLRAVQRVQDETGRARVSDINGMLGYFLPNTTKYINELAGMKMVEKIPAASDKRVVCIQMTALGKECYQKYLLSYHDRLQEALLSIGESDCQIMIQTIERVYRAMQKIYRD